MPGVGCSVAVDGDVAIVGAPTKLGGRMVGHNDHFGKAVAIQGDTLAVGSPGEDGTGSDYDVGAVYMFGRIGGTWTETGFSQVPGAASRTPSERRSPIPGI